MHAFRRADIRRGAARRLTAVFGFVILGLILLGLGGCQSDRPASIGPDLGGGAEVPESVGMSISVRPDYSSGSVNYFQLDAFDESAFALSESGEPLAIVDYGPRGAVPVELKRPEITVVFSQPMVPLARLGTPASSSKIVSIEPEISGRFRWYGSRVLAFEPAADLVSQREFVITVRGSAESLGGRSLGEDVTFSFRTEYLDIASFYPGAPEAAEYVNPDDVPPEAARLVTISFTYPVDLKYVVGFLDVSTAAGPLGFSARRPDNATSQFDEAFVERTVVLELDQSPPADTDVTVTLREGAGSDSRSLGREDAVRKTYHTLRPFRFVDYSTYSWSFPRSDQADSNPVFLEFSHPVTPDEIASYLSTDLPDADLSDNVQVWGTTVRVNNLPVEYESSYQLRIDPRLTDVYGRALGTPESVDVEVPAAASYAYFPNTGPRMLERQFPPRIIWEYQNIFDGLWKVGSIPDPYRSFQPAELEPYDFSGAGENLKQYEILDLSPWLPASGFGWVGLSWNFSAPNKDGERSPWRQSDLQLQVTDLGVTTRYAYNRVLVWVHSLSTNAPVAGAQVQLLRGPDPVFRGGSALVGTTNADGLVRIDLESGEYERFFRDDYRDRIRLAVTAGDDRVVFRPNASHNAYEFGVYDVVGPIRAEEPRMETFLFTDRGLYRPGETVTYRGIDRTRIGGTYGAYVGPFVLQAREQTYQSEPFMTRRGTTSSSGGFYGTVNLPDDLAPGRYTLDYDRDGDRRSVSFQVANFRRSSFQIEVTHPDREYFLGDRLGFSVAATYLSGGGLARSSFDYFWVKSPVSFSPPGDKWEPYVFGPSGYASPQSLSSGSGTLSPVGDATVSQQTVSEGIEGKPYRYDLEVRVQDVDRQELAARSSAIVHPAEFTIGAMMVGVDGGQWTRFVAAGDPVSLRAVFVRPDGTAMDHGGVQDIHVSLIRRRWKVAQQRGVYGRINTRYELVEEVVREDTLELTDGDTAPVAEWSFVPEDPGSYTVRLAASDRTGRTAVTELRFYASGSAWVRWGGDNADAITLVPDRDSYDPGDTARIMVQSPLPGGSYLITTEREGIFDERIVELDGSANLIEVPITDDHVPVVYVAVTSYTARTAPPVGYFEPDLGKPKGYFGLVMLPVNPTPRMLDVEITNAADVYRPGEDAEVTVTVTKNGLPVPGAEVTFLAVDRGVLDLINYHVPNPIDFFYAGYKFPLGVAGADSRSLLIDPVTYEIKNLQGGDAGADKLQRRDDFSPLAVFEPYARTDARGSAVISFSLPDTLTTYRGTAVVVDENRFGIAERELVVQNPVNVRTALPRMLRVRDTSRTGVIVTNIGDPAVEATVALDVRGLTVEGSVTKTVTVPGHESLEVPFTIAATEPGTADLTFTVRAALPSGEPVLAEQLVAHLDIVRPRVEEAFTVTGRTDRDPDDLGRAAGEVPPSEPGNAREVPAAAEEGLIIPTARLPGFGALEMSLTSTRLAEVDAAIRYLAEYPFDYLDNQLTRVLPQIALGTTLEVLPAADVAYKDGQVERFFADLVRSQNDDGGFSYNPRFYSRSSAYVSVKVAHYYALAADGGAAVGGTIDIEALNRYLTGIQSDDRVPDYVKLYGLYAQSLLGVNVLTQLDGYRDQGDDVGLAGYAFLGLAYHRLGRDTIAREIRERVRQFIRIGTRGVDITEPYESRYYFDSQVSQLALIGMLYLALDPADEMNERLARTLSLRQAHGHWINTADTAWAVIAYGRYVAAETGTSTDLDVTVSLGGSELLRAKFQGFITDPVVGEFPLDEPPLATLNRNTLLPLLIRKTGTGMAYYSATLRYALPAEVVLPRDEGLSVYATIEDLSGTAVSGTTLELGRTYRYRASVSTSRNRQMVVLRVPVPSGVDILDASFVTTGRYADAGGVNQRSWERETVYGELGRYSAEGTVAISPFGVDWSYYEPVRQIMDNEVRYFFDEFYPGHQEVTFLFRTTTPGLYPTPPATAVCMYEEEVFGRAAGTLYVIEQ